MERDRFSVVVHVLLLQDDRLFLLRRAGTGFMDGYHGLPGGHQHAGETARAAAARECVEETGVRPLHLEPICVLAYRSRAGQGLNFVFEARGWQGEPGIAEPALFDAGGWYPLADLPRPHAPWITEVLRMRARGEWYGESQVD